MQKYLASAIFLMKSTGVLCVTHARITLLIGCVVNAPRQIVKNASKCVGGVKMYFVRNVCITTRLDAIGADLVTGFRKIQK